MKPKVTKNKFLYFNYPPLLFLGFALIVSLFILWNLHIGKLKNLGNYQIFINSFFHLINYKNLYISFADGLDLYKYSPTFALFMGLFYWMPNYIGIVAWNIFNLMILYIAIKDIEYINNKLLFYCFILLTSWGSFQSSQVNAMMGGLIYLFGICIHKRHINLAAWILAILSSIKIYGAFAIVLLIIFKKSTPRLLLYYLGYCLILFLLPLVVVSFHQLLQLYIDWGYLLYNDSYTYGLSIIGVYAQLFPVNSYAISIINLLGLIYVLGILIKVAKSDTVLSKKLLYNTLSLIMIWMVIFNHKAEPQTYILAYIGVAIWFFTNKKNSTFNYVLILAVFIIALLSDTRLSSHSLKLYLLSHGVTAIICFPVWVTIGFDILKSLSSKKLSLNNHNNI